MKKPIFTVFLLLTIFFSNCKKTDVKTPANVSQDDATALAIEATTPATLALIQSIKELANQDLKRLASGLLKPKEKYFLWQDNIKTASVNFNAAQQLLITELSGFLTPDLFAGPPTAAMTAFRDQWLVKAQKVFTSTQIRAIAYELYPDNDHLVINSAGLKTNDAGLKTCNCNVGSMFACTDGSYCPNDLQYACTATTWQCGFMWGWSCNNLCATLETAY